MREALFLPRPGSRARLPTSRSSAFMDQKPSIPGGSPSMPVAWETSSRIFSFNRSRASVIAARTRSWSIGMSRGSTASGAIVTFSTSIWPFMSTVTRPPPADPVTLTAFSFSWISPTRDCRPCSCLNISNGLVAMTFTFHNLAAKNLPQQLHPLVDLDRLSLDLVKGKLDPDRPGEKSGEPGGEHILFFQNDIPLESFLGREAQNQLLTLQRDGAHFVERRREGRFFPA